MSEVQPQMCIECQYKKPRSLTDRILGRTAIDIDCASPVSILTGYEIDVYPGGKSVFTVDQNVCRKEVTDDIIKISDEARVLLNAQLVLAEAESKELWNALSDEEKETILVAARNQVHGG